MNQLTSFAPNNSLLFHAKENNVASWGLSIQRGKTLGVSVRVSGLGASAKLSGVGKFQMRLLENSKTYQTLKETYHIKGGVSGFYSWLNEEGNIDLHREEISEIFNEVKVSAEIYGEIKYDMVVSGIYPNIPATATAFISFLEVTDFQGNSFKVLSNGNVPLDSGAVGDDNNLLPITDNKTTIEI